jgi:serine/threonine protein kinase
MDALRADDPRQVGPYRLLGRLGEGGMGRVFLGRSAGGRPVAVKLVRPEYGADAQFRRRFRTEVEAARRVGGFYTTQVVDADPDAELPWLVTAYVAGPSLAAAVAEHGRLPTASVRVLGAGLAEGVAAIHACGLVHRDLKPSNVILAADGPRVIDFGIARALEATSGTVTGHIVGTPAYMSPEQVHGRGDIGPPSDVFSLGSVLVFAATGVAPFGEGHPTAVLHRIVAEDPDLSALDGELRDLAAACLSKDPADRPDVADVLARCAGAEASGAWLPEPVTTMVTAADIPDEPIGQGRSRQGLATALDRLTRRRKRPPLDPPPARRRPTSLAESIGQGWNGLRWGATTAEFQARFPGAGQQNGEWWVTGQGPESFCGIEMPVQYGFTNGGRLYLIAFYPEGEDREKLPVAVLNELGAPDGTSTHWTIGDVEVEVKLAGVIATITNTRLSSG